MFANEYNYSHEKWYGSKEVNELNVVINELKKDECAYSDAHLSSCTSHLEKIKNIFDGTRLNQKSLDYIFKKAYKDELNGY